MRVVENTGYSSETVTYLAGADIEDAFWRPVISSRQRQGPQTRPRDFIRHPPGLPISIKESCQRIAEHPYLDEPGGGLCFQTDRQIALRTILEVEIPIAGVSYNFLGKVVWAYPRDKHHEIGLSFGSKAQAFELRMVEQICHIEAYRQRIRADQGRIISSELAAEEWIAKYAAYFPPV